MSAIMIFKLFSNANRINNGFSPHMNSLLRQSKICSFTKAAFCTDAVNNTKPRRPNYYTSYLMSKPETYLNFLRVSSLEKEAQENVESYKKLINLSLEENPSFDVHSEDITRELSSMDETEISKIILVICNTFTYKTVTSNMVKLMKCINDIIFKKELLRENLLTTALVLKKSKFSNMFSVSKKVLNRLFKQIDKLSPEEVVQVFYSIPKRDLSESDYKFTVHSHIHDNISQFNIDEVGIITHGMVNCNLTFNHAKISSAILNKLEESFPNIHPQPLLSICKALVKLTHSLNPTQILDLQEKIAHHVSDLDVLYSVKLSDLGLGYGCINSSFWNTIVKKYKEQLGDLQPHTIARIIEHMGEFNIKDEKFLMQAFEEFKKRYDINKNKEDLVGLLYYLTLFRLYPKDLLDLVLTEEFFKNNVKKSRGTKLMKLHWWKLYCNMKLEKPEYLNYIISKKEGTELYYGCLSIMRDKKISACRYCLWLVKKLRSMMNQLYGENTVLKIRCLPNYESGLVIKFNKCFEVQPILENEISSDGIIYARKPIDDSYYWVFLSVPRNYYINCMESDIGLQATQCRQLEALGYIPIFIPELLFMDEEEISIKSFITDLMPNIVKEKVSQIKIAQ